MNFRNGLEDKSPGFQMAPMVDVIFLLLVFFMVSSIFAQWENKIGIEVPTASTADEPAKRTIGEIIINLDSEGKIYINSREQTPLQLKGILSKIADTFRHQRIIIRADRHTDFEAVIAVLDYCRAADIKDVSFATLNDEN